MPYVIHFNFEEFEIAVTKAIFNVYAHFKEHYPDETPVYIALQTAGMGSYLFIQIISAKQIATLTEDSPLDRTVIKQVLNGRSMADCPTYWYTSSEKYLSHDETHEPSLKKVQSMLTNLMTQSNNAANKIPFRYEGFADPYDPHWEMVTDIYEKVRDHFKVKIQQTLDEDDFMPIVDLMWTESGIML